jgi:hypothetical protein
LFGGLTLTLTTSRQDASFQLLPSHNMAAMWCSVELDGSW